MLEADYTLLWPYTRFIPVDFVPCITLCVVVILFIPEIQDRKGTLDFGSDADFIILDDDLNIMSTYIAGECVYSGG